jgi:hypothetical protein
MASDAHRTAMSAPDRACNWQTSIESRYRSGAIRLAALLSVAIIVFAGWAALNPQPMAWLYVVLVAVFEMWLVRRIRAVGFAPVPPNEPPYDFSGDEAEIVSRYRFYFTHPAIARDSSSVLAAIGLTALLLAPWLTYKQAFFAAILIGLNLFVVARLTKLLAPTMALRVAASRGDRQALRFLEVHDPAWEKIRAANARQ